MKLLNKNVAKAGLLVTALACAAAIAISVDSSVPENPQAGYRFTSGTDTVYRFEYSQDGRIEMGVGQDRPATHLESKARLDFDVRVRGQAHHMISLVIESVRRADIEIMGQDVLPSDRILLGTQLQANLDSKNRVVDIAFVTDTPVAARRVLQLVMGEMQLSLPKVPAERWTIGETTQNGLAQSEYRRTKDGIARHRPRYDSLQALSAFQGQPEDVQVESGTDFKITPDGQLQSISTRESIQASREARVVFASQHATMMTRLRQEPSPQQEQPRFDTPQPLARAIVSPQQRNNKLRQRAQGMTVARVVSDVKGLGALDRRPDHNAWFARSVAALQLEPSGVAALKPLYAETKTLRGRELVLDLLVSAGHDEAQAALVELIDRPETRNHRSGHGLLQRLSLVASPNAEVLAFLQREAFASASDYQKGALYGLGSAARKAIDRGSKKEREAGELAVASLVVALEESNEDGERPYLITALGNAGQPALEPMLIKEASSSRVKIRIHTASALARFDTDASRATLIDLSQDQNRTVQQRALAGLVKSRALKDAELLRLADAVNAQRIREEVLPLLLNAVVPSTVKTPAARPVLEAIVAREFDGDPSVKNRAYMLLARPQTL